MVKHSAKGRTAVIVHRGSDGGSGIFGFGRRFFAVVAIFFAVTSMIPGEQYDFIRDKIGLGAFTPPRSDAANGRESVSYVSSFRETYSEARDAFVKAAKDSDAEVHGIVLDGIKDPSGSDLTIDIAIFRGSPEYRRKYKSLPKEKRAPHPPTENVLIHSSGVHGVELFVGSAIQIDFLRSDAKHLNLKDGDVLVIIHAVNPYGAAWLRRWNENGVDLNRNTIRDPKQRKTLGMSEMYAKLNPFLNPKKRLSWAEAYPLAILRGMYELARHGTRALKDALVVGQWTDPSGIWYGGSEIQQGPRKIYDFLASEHVGLTTDSKTVKRVMNIDIHTGLGPYALDTLITETSLTTLHRAFPGAAYSSTHATDGDVGVAYECAGDFGFYGLIGLAPKSAKWMSVTQEFGTVSPIEVVRALRAEGALVRDDPEASVEEPEKDAVLRAFYPKSSFWRRRCLERGRTVFHQAIYRAFHVVDDIE